MGFVLFMKKITGREFLAMQRPLYASYFLLPTFFGTRAYLLDIFSALGKGLICPRESSAAADAQATSVECYMGSLPTIRPSSNELTGRPCLSSELVKNHIAAVFSPMG